MAPHQPRLDPVQAEQLFQIVLGIIDRCLRTGATDQVSTAVTLLNASRLLLVADYVQQTRLFAMLGMLHWIRYGDRANSSTELDAAWRFFSHVYPVDPRVVPNGLREQFDERQPAPEPMCEVWHTHGKALAEEFVRDGGGLLLDQAIVVYRTSLALAPASYEHRPSMEYNLGTALFQRFRMLKESHDLDTAVATLQRAAQGMPEGHENLPLARFALGVALWKQFEVTSSEESLHEAIRILRIASEQPPPHHRNRIDVLDALSTVLFLAYLRDPIPANLRTALAAAETALAEAPAGYRGRDMLVQRVDKLRMLPG